MSRLRDDNVESLLQQKLEPWMNNPPSYDEMIATYKKYGKINAAIKRKQREISKAEEHITSEIDRPRSNDARKAKLIATATMKDELAELEAELAEVESEVKALEFMRSMFNAANYRTRLAEQYA